MANNFTYPTANQTSDLYEIMKFSNEASGNIFFPLLLFGIWVIAFVGAITEKKSAPIAWTFACFITMVSGMILGILELVSMQYVYLTVLLLAIGMFWLKLSNGSD